LALLAVIGAAWLLDRLFPPDLGRYNRPSTLVLAADGRLLRGFASPQGSWRIRLRPEQVDPLFLRMLIAYEDRRFDYHPGVDPLAVVRALGQWMRHGHVVSGASTLTMQAARLLQPGPRNLPGKALEMLRALQLEWRQGKDDVLSVYLTLAPYGGNLEGLWAASLAYLGKPPRHLTPAEAALLVVLPQAPSRLRPDRFPGAATRARDKVLQRMAALGVLTPRQAVEAMQERVPRVRRALPFHAPHLARRLRRANPSTALLHTGIRYPLQVQLETLARLAQADLDPHAGVALLVVENHGHRVVAYVGNGDFFSTPAAGQVDMVAAVRSPGSTLKPIIYGMGFDDRIIHPETLIDDAPTRFGDYAPSNFRGIYHGEVSVREALHRSLNIPAVAVLQAVGPARLVEHLQRAGIHLYLPGGGPSPSAPDRPAPGLPLALGGIGTTLEDLVRLYAATADGGLALPLDYGPRALLDGEHAQHERVAAPAASEVRLLSEASAWQLARILEQVPRPPGVVGGENTSRRSLAYKTGTSYGFRDAWALGFGAEYTVGVWVGRPDGSPSPGHFGRNTAAPILFRVFDLLPQPTPGRIRKPPASAETDGGAVLAEHLRRFPPRRRAWQSTASSDPPEIRFPPDGATLEDAGDTLPLVAAGGVKPLRWLVNGRPLVSSPVRRTATWPVDGAGAVRISVVDARGRGAQARVWLDRRSQSSAPVDAHRLVPQAAE
jgi:penicillin-binding protein 1C